MEYNAIFFILLYQYPTNPPEYIYLRLVNNQPIKSYIQIIIWSINIFENSIYSIKFIKLNASLLISLLYHAKVDPTLLYKINL